MLARRTLRAHAERRMKALSVQLVTNVAQMVTADDREEIFDALGRVLSVRRGRPVILKRAAFPPTRPAACGWTGRTSTSLPSARTRRAPSTNS